jgi:hypothetical protein
METEMETEMEMEMEMGEVWTLDLVDVAVFDLNALCGRGRS